MKWISQSFFFWDEVTVPQLEKEMATHFSILAWRIPGTEEPGGLPFMGSHRVGDDWSWKSSTLATSCEELTHWKRLWCWDRLGAGGEGDDRGWAGWMASLTRWTWVWVNAGSWWWTGRPGVLRFMGSQRVGHNWATELNWTELFCYLIYDLSWRKFCVHLRKKKCILLLLHVMS